MKQAVCVAGLIGLMVLIGGGRHAEAVILINELLPNPGGFDANRDGTVSATQDEFIELVNTDHDPLSLAGWKLSDALKIRHVFADEAIVPGLGFFVIFGGGTPTGFTHVAIASSGTLSLNNTGDTVTLRDASSSLIDAVIYTNALVGESWTKFPDGSGPFVGHRTVSQLPFSPETTVDGQPHLPNPDHDPVVPEPFSSVFFGIGLVGLAYSKQRTCPI